MLIFLDVPIWELRAFGDNSVKCSCYFDLLCSSLLIFLHVRIWDARIFGDILIILCGFKLLLWFALLLFVHVPIWEARILVMSLWFSVYFSCYCDLFCSFFPTFPSGNLVFLTMSLYFSVKMYLVLWSALLIFSYFSPRFHLGISCFWWWLCDSL